MLDVDHRDVLDQNVRNDIGNTVVLTKRPDRDTVGAVTDEVLDKHVGCVRLEGDTVIAVDNDRVSNDQVVRSVSVP